MWPGRNLGLSIGSVFASAKAANKKIAFFLTELHLGRGEAGKVPQAFSSSAKAATLSPPLKLDLGETEKWQNPSRFWL